LKAIKTARVKMSYMTLFNSVIETCGSSFSLWVYIKMGEEHALSCRA